MTADREADALPESCPSCRRRTIKHEPAEGGWFERRYYACGRVLARLPHVGWATDEHGWMHDAACGAAVLPGLVHLVQTTGAIMPERFHTRFRGKMVEVAVDHYENPYSLGWHFTDRDVAALWLTTAETEAIVSACICHMDPDWSQHQEEDRE